jgi:hypothetical protein
MERRVAVATMPRRWVPNSYRRIVFWITDLADGSRLSSSLVNSHSISATVPGLSPKEVEPVTVFFSGGGLKESGSNTGVAELIGLGRASIIVHRE